jgi:hypothetical protein
MSEFEGARNALRSLAFVHILNLFYLQHVVPVTT